jgi:hypothetical protein
LRHKTLTGVACVRFLFWEGHGEEWKKNWKKFLGK